MNIEKTVLPPETLSYSEWMKYVCDFNKIVYEKSLR
jgi:hypothetical protein